MQGTGSRRWTWEAVTEKLDAGSPPAPDAHNARTTWLTTVNEDGSPHVTAVGALWLDGAYLFQTGSGTRKHRNVERDPRCSIAVSTLDADVVVEGDAERVTDPAFVARAAKAGRTVVGRPSPTRAVRHHRALQRAVAGAAAVGRVSRRAPVGDVVLGVEPGGLTRFKF